MEKNFILAVVSLLLLWIEQKQDENPVLPQNPALPTAPNSYAWRLLHKKETDIR